MLSIDPSSPFRGGALLGDRIRLTEHFLDPGVFIRSMATRGALGGLAEAALQAALLMDAAGRDDVFLETVGVGQAEVDVIDHADTVVLVLMPGSGDSIQALKAGVMEIPDVIVVNKADHPLTDTMVREIRGVLSLAPSARLDASRSSRPRPSRPRASRSSRPSWPSTARSSSPRARCRSAGGATCMTEVLGLGTVRLRRRSRRRCARTRGAELLDEVVARRLDPASAASAVLERGAVDASASGAAGSSVRAGAAAPRAAAPRATARRRTPPAIQTHARPRGPRPWHTTVDQRATRRPRAASPRRRRQRDARHRPERAQDHPARDACTQPPRHQRDAARQHGRQPAPSPASDGAVKPRRASARRTTARRQERRVLGVALLRDEPGEAVAARAPEQPARREAERGERRPAHEARLALEPQQPPAAAPRSA